MKSPTLEPILGQPEQSAWFDYDFYPDTKAILKEIDCAPLGDIKVNLISLIEALLAECDCVIGMPALDMEWGQLCIDTWDFENDSIDYSFSGKSAETIDYFNLLLESHLPFSYSGVCKCNNWKSFLEVTLQTVLTHKAPYSPLLYSQNGNLVMYFHHSGGIGLYYRDLDQSLKRFFAFVQSHPQFLMKS